MNRSSSSHQEPGVGEMLAGEEYPVGVGEEHPELLADLVGGGEVPPTAAPTEPKESAATVKPRESITDMTINNQMSPDAPAFYPSGSYAAQLLAQGKTPATTSSTSSTSSISWWGNLSPVALEVLEKGTGPYIGPDKDPLRCVILITEAAAVATSRIATTTASAWAWAGVVVPS